MQYIKTPLRTVRISPMTPTHTHIIFKNVLLFQKKTTQHGINVCLEIELGCYSDGLLAVVIKSFRSVSINKINAQPSCSSPFQLHPDANLRLLPFFRLFIPVQLSKCGTMAIKRRRQPFGAIIFRLLCKRGYHISHYEHWLHRLAMLQWNLFSFVSYLICSQRLAAWC